MKQRLIVAATAALFPVAMGFYPQVATVPGSLAWAAEMARPAWAGAGALVDKALQAMDGAEEIVFVIRDLSPAYNLSRPEKSMVLLASLSKEAGGYEWYRGEDGQPAATFRETNDPDYRAILQAIQAAKVRQEQYGRPDIRGFRPGDYYVRWMKRFGVLPGSFNLAADRIDPYETDQAYWRSLWYRPPAIRTTSLDGQGL